MSGRQENLSWPKKPSFANPISLLKEKGCLNFGLKNGQFLSKSVPLAKEYPFLQDQSLKVSLTYCRSTGLFFGMRVCLVLKNLNIKGSGHKLLQNEKEIFRTQGFDLGGSSKVTEHFFVAEN
jgi:hypothetical protein